MIDKIKRTIGFAMMLLLTTAVTGCASIKKSHTEFTALQLACVSSPVLYTNLQKPELQRVYLLSNGNDCTQFYRADYYV